MQIAIGALATALIVLVLWPIFVEGEPVLPVMLILFLLAGAGLTVIAARTGKRWARYALLGVIPGAIAGTVGLWALVKYGGGTSGTDGWEDLIAIVAGVMGMFIGAVAGAVCGGVFGAVRGRRRHTGS